MKALRETHAALLALGWETLSPEARDAVEVLDRLSVLDGTLAEAERALARAGRTLRELRAMVEPEA